MRNERSQISFSLSHRVKLYCRRLTRLLHRDNIDIFVYHIILCAAKNDVTTAIIPFDIIMSLCNLSNSLLLSFHPNRKNVHYESKNSTRLSKRKPSIMLIQIREIYPRGKQYCKVVSINHSPLEHQHVERIFLYSPLAINRKCVFSRSY